jgi:hypothetical protein
MKSGTFEGSLALTHLYKEADSAFRQSSESSEAIRALNRARETWEACLSPDLTEMVRASKHFDSQFESIRKLAADQWGVNKSALAAFQSSIKAATTLPPNILALSEVSAKINSQFASIGKALAADTILARGDRDLQLETKESPDAPRCYCNYADFGDALGTAPT